MGVRYILSAAARASSWAEPQIRTCMCPQVPDTCSAGMATCSHRERHCPSLALPWIFSPRARSWPQLTSPWELPALLSEGALPARFRSTGAAEELGVYFKGNYPSVLRQTRVYF